MQENNDNTSWIKAIISFLIALILLAGSVALKVFSVIGEISFVLFIITSLLIGLALYFSDKVKILDFRKGQLILQDIKETEQSVKKLSLLTLELMEVSNEGAVQWSNFDEEKFKEVADKLRKLAT